MTPAKTAKGRAALAQRGTLSRRERQLLILCDAQRTLDDLKRMMGVEIEEDVWRLHAQGLLVCLQLSQRWGTSPADSMAMDFAPTLPPMGSMPRGAFAGL